MAKLLVLHGPNLNLLGDRESHFYGHDTLDTVNQQLKTKAELLGHEISCQQSNAEHELVHLIQQALHSFHFIIINPAAFTHTSIALRDALLAVNLPFIEVHLSNIKARESFRHRSFLEDIACGCITGFGTHSYLLALEAAHFILSRKH